MNVLVVSPHPDDEAIGCGGTLRRHRTEGDAVHVLYVTSGELGMPDVAPAVARGVREREAGHVSQILQTQSTLFWREPDGAVKVTPNLVQKMFDHIVLTEPAKIYVTHFNDAHSDHVVTAQLVRAALGQMKTPPACWMYEVWTPLQKVDHVVDISWCADYKRAAIRAHRSQDERNSFAEAAMALAHFRGLMLGPQKLYAEVFANMPL